MKKILATLLLGTILMTSCGSTATGIFGDLVKKTPRERYIDQLDDRDLDKTPAGRQWIAVSDAALQQPQTVQLPYKQVGIFPADKPRALALRFDAKRGERLIFSIDRHNAKPFTLFAEFFEWNNGAPKMLQAIDTTATEFSYDIIEAGSYVLHLQPELFVSGSYDLSIAVGPSIGFPVVGSKAYVASVWGDVRDGGRRSHEGIDIFAAKGTPAIASEDGYVTSVKEGGIGGKVVWLRPAGKPYTLYYAHLDKQLVSPGQYVQKGDTVGLVGNTGNARTTPPHLHFGIYGFGGAVDPLPFVNKKVKEAAGVNAKKGMELVRLNKTYKTSDKLIPANTLLVPLAVNARGYIVELPEGGLAQLSQASVQSAKQPIRKIKTSAALVIYPGPNADNVPMSGVQPGASLSVIGYHNEFAFVKWGSGEGWILKESLKG